MPSGIQRKARRRSPNLRLTRLRIEAGLSQRRLASLAGVSPAVVQLAEKGYMPHPGNARAVVDVLNELLSEPIRHIDIWPAKGGRA